MNTGINTDAIDQILKCIIDNLNSNFYYLYSPATGPSLLKRYKNHTLDNFVKKTVIEERLNKYPVWVLPLLVGLNENDPSDIDYKDEKKMKHWMLAIVQPNRGLVEIFDSFARPTHMNFWGEIIKQWMQIFCSNKEILVRSFSGQRRHQNGGLNCGLWVCLYLVLWGNGNNITEIENHEKCTENEVETFKYFITVKK